MKYVYHVTKPRSLARVTEEGLKVNQSVSDKELSFWSSRYYGMRPIFVATAFATIPIYMVGDTIRIDADDFELVADLPSLADLGGRVDFDADTMYFDMGGTDLYSRLRIRDIEGLIPLMDEDHALGIKDLLSDTPVADAAIRATGTAAVLEDIGPEKLWVQE